MRAPSRSPFFAQPERALPPPLRRQGQPAGAPVKKPDTKRLLMKRSRYFLQEAIPNPSSREISTETESNEEVDEKEGAEERGAKKKRANNTFEDILRQFKASRAKLRGATTATVTAVSASMATVQTQERKEKVEEAQSCPICLAVVSEGDRARPNTCQHSCFCFSCITAWGHVVNKCPLCKAKFTEIISVSNPQLREEFSSPSRKGKDDDIDEYGNDEYAYEQGLDEVHPLYGYDESDGFVVGDEFVEYNSSDEEDALLDS